MGGKGGKWKKGKLKKKTIYLSEKKGKWKKRKAGEKRKRNAVSAQALADTH